MVTLAEHIKTDPTLTYAQWAERLGISRPMLYGLIDGSRAPSLVTAQRIEAATGGAVKIGVWPNIAKLISAIKAAE